MYKKKNLPATNTQGVFSAKPFLKTAKVLRPECEWQCYTLTEWDLDRDASSPLPRRCLLSSHPKGNTDPMHLFLSLAQGIITSSKRKETPPNVIHLSLLYAIWKGKHSPVSLW